MSHTFLEAELLGHSVTGVATLSFATAVSLISPQRLLKARSSPQPDSRSFEGRLPLEYTKPKDFYNFVSIE